MPSLSSLLQIAASEGRGPSPSFTRGHFLLAFLSIGDSKMIGRQALARETGLGEGAIRTILKKLTEHGYIETIASGCRLTTSGRKVYAGIRQKLSRVIPLEGTTLTVGSAQAAVAVKAGARNLQAGIEQRDSAIMVGASGATTYAIKGGRFTIPGGSSNCERDFPSPAWRVLRKEIPLRDGDAVVLCGGESGQKAKVGAISAALTLL
ncbi:MAG: hypothetical protein LYZ69_05555 [Nitrososphaerales archaeon]|nr:hypothetical protein [Nitrososphaerales archaeon]